MVRFAALPGRRCQFCRGPALSAHVLRALAQLLRAPVRPVLYHFAAACLSGQWRGVFFSFCAPFWTLHNASVAVAERVGALCRLHADWPDWPAAQEWVVAGADICSDAPHLRLSVLQVVCRSGCAGAQSGSTALQLLASSNIGAVAASSCVMRCWPAGRAAQSWYLIGGGVEK